MQFFHCTHNDIQQLKRKASVEITLNIAISSVHLSVLILVLEVVVTNTQVILKGLLFPLLQVLHNSLQ